MRGWNVAAAVALFAIASGTAVAAPARGRLVVFAPTAGGFPLAAAGRAAAIVRDPQDAPAVLHAADDLAQDIGRVTGILPRLAAEPAAAHVVIVGTLGQSRPVDRLVAAGRLDVRRLRGAWESYLIATVRRPYPGVEQALVIVGSDRRGAAYGAYELGRAIGVSPWVWWADVAPRRRDTLIVAAGTRRFGPPSVRYRGIFINDEDWGLFPWVAKTHDPERGNFGPKTYARVFQLLMRLRANTLWPAMHKTSAPFNADPANARLADEYGIVMSASHAEPMLRNNVGEWSETADRFNYAANPGGVRAYWEARVRENARYESLWPIGMRGIHDSGLVGADTGPEKLALLGRIIADQRALLGAHVASDAATVPQLFTPYKEVLDIYRLGLKVPDDVTLVWPDDNFGYIRQLPNPAERVRAGGNGVYYHLSYLGAPLSYLWLGTTPPALMREEMTRAFDAGARRVWIANVGDIKLNEIGTELFLDLAWDVNRHRGRSQREVLDEWAARTFGEQGPAVGEMLDEYYRLNFERRPEHLQWWLPGQRPRPSGVPAGEVDGRLARFASLVARTVAVARTIPRERSDAFFELVGYPVRASAAANRRVFAAERYARLIDTRPADARNAAGAALAADAEIKTLTERYNAEIAGGKWRGIVAEEPADNQWASMRLSPVVLPAASLANAGGRWPAMPAEARAPIHLEAEDAKPDGWRLVDGLGRGRGTMMARTEGARMRFRLTVPPGAPRRPVLGLLPLFPDGGDTLSLDVAVDGAAPRRLAVPRRTGSAEWSAGVLDNLLAVPLGDALAPGAHDVTVTARSSGVAVDRLTLVP